jgi:hypothetical protein
VFGQSYAALAQASTSFWKTTLSTPEDVSTLETINLDYQVASTEASDTFNVELFVDGVSANSANGVSANNGGSFLYSFPAEGEYEFYTETTNIAQASTRTSQTVSVMFDESEPSSPIYEGVERNGNTYTVRFTAPSNDDVASVRIYASTAQNFDLSDDNLVATVPVTSGQDVEYDYTAPDSTQRYFAVVAVDTAGNESPADGDTRTRTVTVSRPGGGSTTDGTGTGGTGTGTDGEETDGDGNEEVLGEEDGTDTEGEATGEESEDDSGSNAWLIALIGAGLVAGWYVLTQRGAKTKK